MFLEEIGEKEIAQLVDRARKIRNEINYYGRITTLDEVEYSQPRIKKARETLIKKYLNEF